MQQTYVGRNTIRQFKTKTSETREVSWNGHDYSVEFPLICVEVPFDSHHCFCLGPLLDRILDSSLLSMAAGALVLQYA